VSASGKVLKFVKIRVRLHNKQRWRDVSTKRAVPFAALLQQLTASFGLGLGFECVAIERVLGEATMAPAFYSADDCLELAQGAEYIAHTADSKTDRECQLVQYRAVIKIQAVARGWRQVVRFRAARGAATRLQSVGRGLLARRLANRRRLAGVKLQAFARGCSQASRFHRLQRVVSAVQTAFRARRRSRAAVRLQAAVRGGLARFHKRKQAEAATDVQRVVRGQKARLAFVQQREAAVFVQRSWRSFQWRIYEQQCSGAALLAQQIGRGWLARSRLDRLERFFRLGLLRT
jgi:hypothetical protein